MTIAFLRIYAYNLGRKWRNSPDVACDDAILVMCVLSAAPVGAILLAAVALTGAAHLRQVLDSKVLSYPIAFAVALALLYGFTKAFSRFAETPERARPYMAPRAQLISLIGILLTELICSATIAFVFYVTG
jgi:hypothetical protein